MFYVWTLVLFVTNIVVAKENLFTYDEKKAFRREMVELDVQIRNLSSAISLGYVHAMQAALIRLSTSRTSVIPRYKKAMRSVHAKLKKNLYYIYLENIRSEAKGLREIVDDNLRKNKKMHWGDVTKRHQTIIKNCRLCHSKMLE